MPSFKNGMFATAKCCLHTEDAHLLSFTSNEHSNHHYIHNLKLSTYLKNQSQRNRTYIGKKIVAVIRGQS